MKQQTGTWLNPSNRCYEKGNIDENITLQSNNILKRCLKYDINLYHEKNRSRNKLLLNFIKRFSSGPVRLLVFQQLPGNVENE
jgi:hypothetical protein